MAAEGACALHLSGHGSNLVKQKVAVSGHAGDAHTLTFWARTSAVGGSGHNNQVRVIVTYSDGSEEAFSVDLPDGTSPWTQYSLTFIAGADYTQLQVQIMFGRAQGEVWYDDFILQ